MQSEMAAKTMDNKKKCASLCECARLFNLLLFDESK